MDPAIATIVTIFSTAIAALFGALMISMRQQREDWKGLFESEKADHKATLQQASEQNQKNTQAVRDLADFLHELPRRSGDWNASESRRR